jgi:hypothetical protein
MYTGMVGRVTVFGYVEALLLPILVPRFLGRSPCLEWCFPCADGLRLRLC